MPTYALGGEPLISASVAKFEYGATAASPSEGEMNGDGGTFVPRNNWQRTPGLCQESIHTGSSTRTVSRPVQVDRIAPSEDVVVVYKVESNNRSTHVSDVHLRLTVEWRITHRGATAGGSGRGFGSIQQHPAVCQITIGIIVDGPCKALQEHGVSVRREPATHGTSSLTLIPSNDIRKG